jgi:hypothetical protein
MLAMIRREVPFQIETGERRDMSHISVRCERIIEAKPEEVFAALADYNNKRPRILTPNFLNYTVEEGGKGSGTIITYILHVGGRERAYRMVVDESQTGQLLAERDSNSSLVTRWSVQPLDGNQRSRVSVESDWEGSRGVGGFFERTFAPASLRSIYNHMLLALALLTQSPQKSQKIMKIDRKSLPTNTGIAVLAVGSAVALGAGLRYWWSRQKA